VEEAIGDEMERRGSRSDRIRIAVRAAEFLVLALLLVIDFEVGARASDSGDEALVGALATAFVAVAVAVLTLARRRMPTPVVVAAVFAVSVLASVVSVAVGSPSLSLTETAALVVITVFGVRGSSARGAIVVSAAALVVAASAVLLRVEFDATVVLLAALIWVCAVTGGIATRYLRMRRETAEDEARRAERMELARELHDVVAHQVTGIVVQAQAAIAVAHTDPARAAEAFSAIESAGTEALSGMRRMVGAIRDDADRDSPLTVPYGLDDIPGLVDRFDPGRERTTLRLDAPSAPMPPGVGESAYRVVREALTNVHRHAPEAITRVSVRVIDAELVLEIDNDGVRSRPIDGGSGGFGLTGMRERVAALGGRMRAGAEEAGTWTVWVALPMDAAR